MVETDIKSNEATLSPVVRATNALTARWCSRLGSGDFTLSGAGLWPLLALVASAGDESARAELGVALGRLAASAQQDALELIDILRTGESTTAALGLWTRKDIPMHQEWAAGIPEAVVGKLTDQEALDRRAAQETGGLIDKFPLEITPATTLVLASALAARVKWCEPSDTRPRDRNREPMEPDQQWLFRTTYDLGAAVVLDDAVARVIVEGNSDLDVQLLIGDQHPADVLSAGLRELSGEVRARPVTESDSGRPGLNVRRVESWIQQDILRVKLPSFEIKTHYELLEQTELFGLGSLTDPVTSHLPLLSPVPLLVSDVAQDVLSRFYAEGFEAAAVTAFGVYATARAT